MLCDPSLGPPGASPQRSTFNYYRDPFQKFLDNMSGPPISTPNSAIATEHVSVEQYRYALTNFVRTYHRDITPLTLPLIPHMDSLRLSRIRKSRNSGGSSRSRSGRSHGYKHA